MPTRNVVLTQHQTELIEKLVDSGKYQNASEVLRDGLRLIEIREVAEKAKLKALRNAAQVAIDQIEAGQFRDFDSTEELDSYLRSLVQEALIGGHQSVRAKQR